MNTRFWQDAGMLLHQLDHFGKRALLLPVTEEVYRSSVFMDERLATAKDKSQVVPLWSLEKDLPTDLPDPYFIFHISHCGSTMVSRILQIVSRLLPLREPVPLRTMANLLREKGDPLETISPQDCDHMLKLVLATYQRTFANNPRALIKPTSSCCNLVDSVMAGSSSRALFMYLSLDSFLASLLRSDIRRQETASFASSRLADLHHHLDDDSIRLWHLEDYGRLTALSWVANMLWMVESENTYGDRLLTMNFEALLANPTEQLAAITDHFAISASTAALGDAFGHVTSGYSKDPTMKYSPEARNQEIEMGRQRFAKELQTGKAWVHELMKRFPKVQALEPFID